MDVMLFSDEDDDIEIQGHFETAGAAPVDTNRHNNAPLNNARSSSGKGHSGTLHWFAQVGNDPAPVVSPRTENGEDPKWLAHEGSSDGAHGTSSSTEPGKDGASQKERDERIRLLRERQNEERQRKLEELKSQALAAQKFREQKEEERRRRIEELRSRDTDRRYQVEERKRQIWEAERDRREAILRKNQEREARIDSKRKNERSSIVFAFGSSTPRMLEPADTGGSFWGHRRATSTTNVMMFAAAPLTRRSSERELDGSKKRATSASGLDRKPEDDVKMSASMYEVFNWDTAPEANVVSNVPSQVDKPNDSTPNQGSNELHLNVAGQGFIPYRNSSKIGAVDDATDASGAPGYNAPVNRRKTDLTPTIPSPRDGTPSRSLKSAPFSRSPGRAFSMSRLDQLSQPRRRPMACVDESGSTNGKPLGSSPASVSRSMSHLAAGKQRALRKTDNTRSMSQLTAPPVPPPRATRAERLRQRAREMAKEKGMRSGEVTPLPPSRPLSALSQQSVNSVQSGVSLRSRPIAAARKPRPFSIAVTGVSQDVEPRGGTYRHSISGEIRTSKAMTSSIERMDSAKPPLPKPHATRRPPTKPEAPPRKVTDRVKSASAKASPRITPKATPLQSPGTETAPPVPRQEPTEPSTEASEAVVEAAPEPQEVPVLKPQEVPAEKPQEVPTEPEVTRPAPDVKVVDVLEKQQVEKQQVEKQQVEVLEEVDMTASMMAKTRITTEGEAKAALAERRRVAREQAEREAEAERQRQEEERLAEEERMVQEEEEQRRFEEEQMRLLEETRRAEDERLLLAIQENEKREEEEKKRREEEALAKIEKEEADKKAREEAERLRQEMDERLKKEEEERVARRKRVEAIMLRTRGKGGTPANTPTKDGDSEGDEGKDESPTEETKTETDKSLMLSASASDNHVTGNGLTEEKVSTSSSAELLLIDNTNGKPMEISEEDLNIASEPTAPQQQQQSNGHRNGMDYNSVDFVNVDNMKQNKTTSNNLLDFSEFETLSNDQSSTSASDLLAPSSGKFMNEDNVNSNIMNGPNAPFIAFSDNLTKKQDSNTVTDLLS